LKKEKEKRWGEEPRALLMDGGMYYARKGMQKDEKKETISLGAGGG